MAVRPSVLITMLTGRERTTRTYFIAGNTAVENARSLAQSALPNAPQEPHQDPRPRRTVAARARLSAALRTAAERELKLADRIDPAPRCEPFPS